MKNCKRGGRCRWLWRPDKRRQKTDIQAKKHKRGRRGKTEKNETKIIFMIRSEEKLEDGKVLGSKWV